MVHWRKQFARTKQMTIQSTRPTPALSRPPGQIKQGNDSSLDSVQRLHFTSSLQGQYVAARTAEVKRLSASQQKQLMFPNNRGLVGGFQRSHDRARGGWNWILLSASPPLNIYLYPFISVVILSEWNPSVVRGQSALSFSFLHEQNQFVKHWEVDFFILSTFVQVLPLKGQHVRTGNLSKSYSQQEDSKSPEKPLNAAICSCCLLGSLISHAFGDAGWKLGAPGECHCLNH